MTNPVPDPNYNNNNQNSKAGNKKEKESSYGKNHHMERTSIWIFVLQNFIVGMIYYCCLQQSIGSNVGKDHFLNHTTSYYRGIPKMTTTTVSGNETYNDSYYLGPGPK
jgi:putative exporter of polyketide antibiotics